MSLQDAHKNADSVHPATQAVAVTKSDTTQFKGTRGLWVGVSGSVVVTFLDGSDATFAGVLGGTLLPIQVFKVKAATTASSILALY